MSVWVTARTLYDRGAWFTKDSSPKYFPSLNVFVSQGPSPIWTVPLLMKYVSCPISPCNEVKGNYWF